MGDDVPAAKLGDPAVVKEWALLEGRGLGGLVMAFASVRVKDRKETMTPIILALRNQMKTKDASERLRKSIHEGNECTRSIKIFWWVLSPGYTSESSGEWDFAGGLVVRTLCFHWWGHGFGPWLGN